MKAKTHRYEIDGEQYEAIVEECSRKEFIEWALGTIEAVIVSESFDDTLWVEYKDGTHYYCSYFDCDSSDSRTFKFRKTNIVFGLISNGSTWQVFGDYELDENGIPQRA